jgi:hypothetical protein
MKNQRGDATSPPDRARELRAELARGIALFMGSAENRATDIPGLTLHRRTAPTAPCSMTYAPGVIVIAQGRKRVELGRNIFIYDASRFLLTSVDLPVISRVSEASEERLAWRCRSNSKCPWSGSFSAGRRFGWLKRRLTVPAWRPVRPRWNSSVRAAGSWIC